MTGILLTFSTERISWVHLWMTGQLRTEGAAVRVRVSAPTPCFYDGAKEGYEQPDFKLNKVRQQYSESRLSGFASGVSPPSCLSWGEDVCMEGCGSLQILSEVTVHFSSQVCFTWNERSEEVCVLAGWLIFLKWVRLRKCTDNYNKASGLSCNLLPFIIRLNNSAIGSTTIIFTNFLYLFIHLLSILDGQSQWWMSRVGSPSTALYAKQPFSLTFTPMVKS